MIHELKIKEEFFAEILKGEKPYEVRKNDRGYREGDYLALNEIDQDGTYTNRSVLCTVKNVFYNPDYTKEDYVIMTIAPCAVEKRQTCSVAYSLVI